MSRLLSTLAATTALALATLTVPVIPAYAAAPFDGTWIIDVSADTIRPDDSDPTCPALRLRVQITDNQMSGDFRRSYPEEHNVVENGGTNRAAQVTGHVAPDGTVTAQWQNFHTAGKMVGDKAALTMDSECGPLRARAHRLEDESVAMNATTAASGSSDAQSDASAASHHDGYNVYFAFDMSILTAKGQEIVTAAASATRADQTSRVALVGKADLSGTDPYNMALSQRRADTVRDALVAGGVPADRIDTRWVGDREPPVPTAAGVRDAQNRVVEVAFQ